MSRDFSDCYCISINSSALSKRESVSSVIFMALLIDAAKSALGLVFLVIYFQVRDTKGVKSLSLL